MNADERKSLIKDIVDVLEVRVIKPMERRIETRLDALEKADDELKAKDAKLSGQHRAVTTHMIPLIKSETKQELDGANAGIADAFNKMVHVVSDMGDAIARIEAVQAPLTVVEVPDGRGGKSVRPASLIAAESSVRTEVKQESLGKVVLETALDATKAKNDGEDVKKWQKRITTPLLVATPVLVELVHQVWPYIFH